jgi:hypothetical protein
MKTRIGVVTGHLMFRLKDGSSLSCECIGEPYASQVASMQDDIDRLISCLKNARNILEDGKYLYVKEIDKLLSELS